MIIYHIVLPEVWENYESLPFYEAESLQTEKFIHCSFAGQLDGVLERYYKGVEKVLVLSIDTDKLSAKLVHEPSTNNEIYPHIYGKINIDSIVEVSERNLQS